MRSVPAEINEHEVLIDNWPRPGLGHGTSANSISPVLRCCNICFMARFSNQMAKSNKTQGLSSAQALTACVNGPFVAFSALTPGEFPKALALAL